MADLFRIEDAVVTGEALQRQHQGQGGVSIPLRAVVTPTGWDYIRQHRLEVVRAAEGGAAVSPETVDRAEDGELVQEGRCDQPDKAFGCQTEEFGSGFVEPTSCDTCAINKMRLEGRQDVSCHGCNRHRALQQATGIAPDELVRHIADLVAQRLGK